MDKASIKSKVKVEAKGIERMMAVSEGRENIRAEVKQNGKGEMETIGLSAVIGRPRSEDRDRKTEIGRPFCTTT